MSSGGERGAGGSGSVKASAPSAEERCALAVAFLRASCANGRFDQAALSQLSDISAEPGVVRCSLPVTEAVQNRYGTLHGGCIATLVDVVTTAALVTVSDFSGVTLELSAAYLNPCAAGDVAEVEARVLKAGGAVAVMSCVISARRTGRAVANGRHTKYLPRTAVAPQLQAMLKAQQGRTGADTAAAALLNSKL